MVVVAAVVYPKGPETESHVSVSSSAYKDKQVCIRPVQKIDGSLT